jgi:hypothetical protein
MVDFIIACCVVVLSIYIVAYIGDFIFLGGLLAGAAGLAYGAYTGAISGHTVGGILLALLLFKALYPGTIFGWPRRKCLTLLRKARVHQDKRPPKLQELVQRQNERGGGGR